MRFLRPLAGSYPFPASSTRGLAALAGGFLTVTRLPVNGPQVRIGVIIPSDKVVHLIGAGSVTDMANAPVVAEDALALSVPFLGQAHAAGTALPLSGSHARVLSARLP